jgi:predicted ATP-binding protein involved in virulence
LPFRRDLVQDPDWLKEHKNSFRVRFIQSQRLLMRSERTPGSPNSTGSQYEYTVSAYAKELSETINRKVAEYGRLTASYERSFPSRFVAQPDTIVEPGRLLGLRSELRERLSAIDAKRAELQNAGLLDRQTDDQLTLADTFSDAKLIFLDLYTRDIETKLKAFDDLTPRIKLFTDILNSRLSYKRLSISRERGFLISLDGQGDLTPEDLSSGEQHELVLCFELLFKTGPGYFVMIDEPEISLHVEWQEAFLSDLHQIAQVSQFDSLIATHSPIIVGNRWDLTESLSSLVGMPS